jgi:putative ABC transport system permease protein
MAAQISQNRQMFWRITRRMLGAHRGRLFVVLLALGAGAAVTAALLNLQVDAKLRLTTEFRTFGPNVIISPRNVGDTPTVFSETLFTRIPDRTLSGEIAAAEFLYGVVDVSASRPDHGHPDRASASTRAVLVGYAHSDVAPQRVVPPALIDAERNWKYVNSLRCAIGAKVASTLKVKQYEGIRLQNGPQIYGIAESILPPTGGPEDNQIFVYLDLAQRLLGKPGQISVIQLSVPGSPQQVQRFVDQLQPSLGDVEGRPIRQFTEAQAKIYDHISSLLNATVMVVLVLTSLCVMAAMTNVAVERKNDVGLMKAIGGATRRVLRLFLAEAALLGLAGGALGAAAGILLSIWLGKQVFGVAAQPRLIVYPVAVALTMIVAILSAFPLRRLAGVRPASVFRGEA